jgi:hypothetical protein
MQFHGVDFAGGDDGGTHKIRVASWREGQPISIVRVDRRGLVRLVLASAQEGSASVWRIDAASGLPLATLGAHGQPAAWITAARWMNSFGSARGWRTALRARSRVEPRRVTDHESHAALAPMNLRAFKQTWACICEVLVPLHDAGVSLDPLAVKAGGCVVCEASAASALRARGWPSHGFKGGGDPPARLRRDLVERVRGAGVPLSQSLAEHAISDEAGEMLDALVLLLPGAQTVVPVEGAVEGWTY